MDDRARASAMIVLGCVMLLQAGPARGGDAVRSQAAVDSEWTETVEALWPRLAFFVAGFEQCLYGAESAEALAACRPLARKAKSVSDGILEASRTVPVSRPLVAARDKARAACEALSGGLESFLRFVAAGDERLLGEVASRLEAARPLREQAGAELERAMAGTAPEEPGAPRLAARGTP